MEKWERREQKRQAQRAKMHGKTLGKIYRDAVLKKEPK